MLQVNETTEANKLMYAHKADTAQVVTAQVVTAAHRLRRKLALAGHLPGASRPSAGPA